MSEILIKANQVIDEAVITFLGRINDITENGPYKKSKKFTQLFRY